MAPTTKKKFSSSSSDDDDDNEEYSEQEDSVADDDEDEDLGDDDDEENARDDELLGDEEYALRGDDDLQSSSQQQQQFASYSSSAIAGGSGSFKNRIATLKVRTQEPSSAAAAAAASAYVRPPLSSRSKTSVSATAGGVMTPKSFSSVLGAVMQYRAANAHKAELIRFQLSLKEDHDRFKKNKRMYFKITGPSSNVVRHAWRRAGFVKTGGSSWNTLWGKILTSAEFKELTPYQKVNHFPGASQLGRKDSLARNISRFRRDFGSENFDYHPKTFLLPRDYNECVADMDSNEGSLYILKPNNAARGIGIKLLSGSMQVPRQRSCLVQRYVADPFLINGLKFDLRVYVLVTCIDPLRIYVFDDGLARFCTEKYDSKTKTHKNRYRHLTNYSLQKNRSCFVQNTDPEKDNVGNKWSLRALREWLREHQHDDVAVWDGIKDVIIKTILTAEPHIATNVQLFVPHRTNCFELLGFDILLDSKLQPWLMEVNICPALNCDSPLDKKIKSALVTNAFDLMGVYAYDRKKFKEDNDTSKQMRLMGLVKNPAAKGSSESTKRRDVLCGKARALDNLSEEDLQILKEADEELERCGRFEKIFPCENAGYYDQFFQTRRYANVLLMEWVQSKALYDQNPPISPTVSSPLSAAATVTGQQQQQQPGKRRGFSPSRPPISSRSTSAASKRFEPMSPTSPNSENEEKMARSGSTSAMVKPTIVSSLSGSVAAARSQQRNFRPPSSGSRPNSTIGSSRSNGSGNNGRVPSAKGAKPAIVGWGGSLIDPSTMSTDDIHNRTSIYVMRSDRPNSAVLRQQSQQQPSQQQPLRAKANPPPNPPNPPPSSNNVNNNNNNNNNTSPSIVWTAAKEAALEIAMRNQPHFIANEKLPPLLARLSMFDSMSSKISKR